MYMSLLMTRINHGMHTFVPACVCVFTRARSPVTPLNLILCILFYLKKKIRLNFFSFFLLFPFSLYSYAYINLSWCRNDNIIY